MQPVRVQRLYDAAVLVFVYHLFPVRMFVQHRIFIAGDGTFRKIIDRRMNLKAERMTMIDKQLKQIQVGTRAGFTRSGDLADIWTFCQCGFLVGDKSLHPFNVKGDVRHAAVLCLFQKLKDIIACLELLGIGRLIDP
jgi:hypothetical protein